MKVILKSIKISDFKGISKLEWDFINGKNVVIGKNGSGKTSFLDAIFWVLFGKTQDDRTKFDMIPLDENGDQYPTAEPTVELTMNRGMSDDDVLRKYLKHGKIAYEINAIPIGATQYDKWVVDNICTSDVFKMLINPLFIGDHLIPTKQRELFLSYFEPPKQSVVLGHMDNLGESASSRFVGELARFSPAEILLRTEKETKDLKQAIDEGVGEIRLLDQQLRESSIDLSRDELTAKRDRIQRELDSYQENLNKQRDRDRALLNADMDVRRAESRINDFKAQTDQRLQSAIKTKESLARAKGTEVQAEREKFKKIAAQPLGIECPTCGQTVPEKQMKLAKAKKTAQLQEIKKRGNELNVELEELSAQIETLKSMKSLPTDKQDLEQMERDLESAKEKYKSLPPMETVQQLPGLSNELAETKTLLAQIDTLDRDKRRKSDIVALQKRRASDLEYVTVLAKDCKEYEKAMAAMIVNAINKHFKGIRISLFEVLKNGTIRDTFSITKDGVPYSELNTAGKLLAGLELTTFIADRKELHLPVIIDNYERYTDVVLPDGIQSIVCKASKGSKLSLKGEE